MFECQPGFTKGKSTESALLVQKEIILENIEVENLTLGIFIDYSKAFDSLYHGTHLTKLEEYGIRGVVHSLLQSYLSGRQRCVVIDGSTSSFRPLLNGLPQRSILRPFLFNVYVNDLPSIDMCTDFVFIRRQH